MTVIRYSSTFDCSQEDLFAFHSDVSNLARISGGLPRVSVEAPERPTEPGDVQHITLDFRLFRLGWDAEVTRVLAPDVIEDVQVRGPFHRWRHRHLFSPVRSGAVLTDAVSFRLLPTIAGEFVEYWTVRPAMLVMFWMRHRKTRQLLEAAKRQGG